MHEEQKSFTFLTQYCGRNNGIDIQISESIDKKEIFKFLLICQMINDHSHKFEINIKLNKLCD